MLNLHLSYKPTSSWKILFWYWGWTSQISCLKKLRDLVVPSGRCYKGTILQGILTPTGVLPNGQSWLRRKWDVTGPSVHTPIHRNRTYGQTIIRYIYKTIWTKHPPSSIHRQNYTPREPLLIPIALFVSRSKY